MKVWDSLSKNTRPPVVIVGLDPAVMNFGWAAVNVNELNEDRQSFELLGSGVLVAPKDIKKSLHQDNIRRVILELTECVRKFDPLAVAVERYTLRGKRFSGDIEYINILIGAIMASACVPLDLFTASTWKTNMLRGRTVEQRSKEWFPDCSTVHEADAGCIALFCYTRLVKSGYIVEGKSE